MSYAAINSTARRTAAGLAAALVLLAGCDDAQGPAEPGPAPVPVAHVEVAPSGGGLPGLLLVGDTLRLAATARSATGEEIPGRPVTWASAEPAVATVSTSGKVTALAPGLTSIRATIGGRIGTLPVRVVTSAGVHTVTVEQADGGRRDPLAVGDTVKLIAVARNADGEVVAGRPVAWASTAPEVLQVDAAGLLTARGAGTATITAYIDGREGATAYTVSSGPGDAVVVEVRVNPTGLIVAVGGIRTLTARAYDYRGVEIHGRPVTWSSNAAGVAAVDQHGVITAIAPGYAEIHATIDGRTGAATVTVPTPEPVRFVFVTPSTASVWIGAERQLTVALAGTSGGAVTGRTVTWHSENPGIATVDAAGRVRGIARGTARIVATSEGVTGVATVNVWQYPAGPVHTYRLNGVVGARGVPRYLGSGDWVDGDGVTHRVSRFIERGTLTLRFDTGRYEQVVEVDLYADGPWRRVATITLRDEGTLSYLIPGGYGLRSDDPSRPLVRAEVSDVAELTAHQDVAGSGTIPWVWLIAQD